MKSKYLAMELLIVTLLISATSTYAADCLVPGNCGNEKKPACLMRPGNCQCKCDKEAPYSSSPTRRPG
ncbi:hypothetical protein V5799_031404 [Amblyomma americanum]|uniref:Secreted protein n=1 Tax=Amblyomma americanum TaxID=6943 RepID=A0AAQ4EKU9_AMBAM